MRKKITLFVISIHLFFIAFLLFAPPQKTPPPKKPIAIRTALPIKKVTPRPVAAKTPPKTKPAPPPPPKKSAPAKTSPQAPPQKKTVPSKKPVAKENPKPPKKSVPAKIENKVQEPLAKIEEKVYRRPQLQLDVPKLENIPLEPAPIDEEKVSVEESLVSFLHASLNLPEFGEVKIQLTIKKDGTVARLVVVETESKKNKAYLEQHLPKLRLPLGLEQEKTFTLTFCNEV